MIFLPKWSLEDDFRPRALKIPRMALRCLKSKSTCSYLIYAPMLKMFICFTVQWAVFELRPSFEKITPYDPVNGLGIYIKSKVHMDILHKPSRPILAYFSLYDEPFSNYGPIWRRVHRMNPKFPWHVQGQKWMSIPHMPLRPKFRPFHLRWSVSSHGPILRKVHRMTPNWSWHGQKYLCAIGIHSRCRFFFSSVLPFRSTIGLMVSGVSKLANGWTPEQAHYMTSASSISFTL